MVSNKYTRLGDYIQAVNVRNKDLNITRLLGVNLSKDFIPSVANIIGTDLSKYKVIKKGQFGCKLMSVERDGILPISLYKDDLPAIISSAYHVFEVIDEKVLLPDYLMLYFKYPEFDRQLQFFTGGDVRGGMNYNDFCDIKIYVPSIDIQRKLVDEYQSINCRYEHNRKLISNLESVAYTLYFHTFVENYDNKIIPDGWSVEKLNTIASFKVGGDCPETFSNYLTNECSIPIYSNGEYLEGLYGYTDSPSVTEHSFTISARGNVGTCFIRRHPYRGIVRLISVIPKDRYLLYYLFFVISLRNLKGDGSAQSQITVPQLSTEEVLVPDRGLLRQFHEQCEAIYSEIDIIKKEQIVLKKVENLILTKL